MAKGKEKAVVSSPPAKKRARTKSTPHEALSSTTLSIHSSSTSYYSNSDPSTNNYNHSNDHSSRGESSGSQRKTVAEALGLLAPNPSSSSSSSSNSHNTATTDEESSPHRSSHYRRDGEWSWNKPMKDEKNSDVVDDSDNNGFKDKGHLHRTPDVSAGVEYEAVLEECFNTEGLLDASAALEKLEALIGSQDPYRAFMGLLAVFTAAPAPVLCILPGILPKVPLQVVESELAGLLKSASAVDSEPDFMDDRSVETHPTGTVVPLLEAFSPLRGSLSTRSRTLIGSWSLAALKRASDDAQRTELIASCILHSASSNRAVLDVLAHVRTMPPSRMIIDSLASVLAPWASTAVRPYLDYLSKQSSLTLTDLHVLAVVAAQSEQAAEAAGGAFVSAVSEKRTELSVLAKVVGSTSTSLAGFEQGLLALLSSLLTSDLQLAQEWARVLTVALFQASVSLRPRLLSLLLSKCASTAPILDPSLNLSASAAAAAAAASFAPTEALIRPAASMGTQEAARALNNAARARAASAGSTSGALCAASILAVLADPTVASAMLPLPESAEMSQGAAGSSSSARRVGRQSTTSALVPYGHFLEEALHAGTPPPPAVAHRLSHALVSLAPHSASLSTSLVIFTRKTVFSSAPPALKAVGLILARHILAAALLPASDTAALVTALAASVLPARGLKDSSLLCLSGPVPPLAGAVLTAAVGSLGEEDTALYVAPVIERARTHLPLTARIPSEDDFLLQSLSFPVFGIAPLGGLAISSGKRDKGKGKGKARASTSSSGIPLAKRAAAVHAWSVKATSALSRGVVDASTWPVMYAVYARLLASRAEPDVTALIAPLDIPADVLSGSPEPKPELTWALATAALTAMTTASAAEDALGPDHPVLLPLMRARLQAVVRCRSILMDMAEHLDSCLITSLSTSHGFSPKAIMSALVTEPEEEEGGGAGSSSGRGKSIAAQVDKALAVPSSAIESAGLMALYGLIRTQWFDPRMRMKDLEQLNASFPGESTNAPLFYLEASERFLPLLGGTDGSPASTVLPFSRRLSLPVFIDPIAPGHPSFLEWLVDVVIADRLDQLNGRARTNFSREERATLETDLGLALRILVMVLYTVQDDSAAFLSSVRSAWPPRESGRSDAEVLEDAYWAVRGWLVPEEGSGRSPLRSSLLAAFVIDIEAVLVGGGLAGKAQDVGSDMILATLTSIGPARQDDGLSRLTLPMFSFWDKMYMRSSAASRNVEYLLRLGSGLVGAWNWHLTVKPAVGWLNEFLQELVAKEAVEQAVLEHEEVRMLTEETFMRWQVVLVDLVQEGLRGWDPASLSEGNDYKALEIWIQTLGSLIEVFIKTLKVKGGGELPVWKKRVITKLSGCWDEVQRALEAAIDWRRQGSLVDEETRVLVGLFDAALGLGQVIGALEQTSRDLAAEGTSRSSQFFRALPRLVGKGLTLYSWVQEMMAVSHIPRREDAEEDEGEAGPEGGVAPTLAPLSRFMDSDLDSIGSGSDDWTSDDDNDGDEDDGDEDDGQDYDPTDDGRSRGVSSQAATVVVDLKRRVDDNDTDEVRGTKRRRVTLTTGF